MSVTLDAVSTSSEISKWFIQKGYSAGNPMTQLKLHKILFFAQGWHLSLFNGVPLFYENFEAWKYGPVLSSIYQEYKSYGSSPIGSIHSPGKIGNKETQQLLEDVYETFGTIAPNRLVSITHDPKGPWYKIYSQYGNEVIDKMSIKAYFDSLSKRSQ